MMQMGVSRKLSRRSVLKAGTLLLASSAVAGCAGPAPTSPAKEPTSAPAAPATKAPTAAQATPVAKAPTTAPATPASKAAIKIQFWHNSGALQALREQQAAKFHEQYPNLTVEPVMQGSTAQILQKIQTALAGGEPPDCTILLNYMAVMLFEQGSILPLDPFIAADKSFNKDDVYEELWKAQTWKQNILMVPQTAQTWCLYYNKQVFEKSGVKEPPKNWAELADVAKRCTKDTDGDGKVDQFGLMLNFRGHTEWLCFVYNNGGNIFNPEVTKCLLDQPPAVEALKFWDKLINEDKVVTDSPFDQGFAMNKVAMFMSGTWYIMNLYKLQIPFGVTHVPFQKSPLIHTDCSGFALFKTTPERQDATWKWLTYQCRKEYYETLVQQNYWAPIHKSHAEDPKFKEWLQKYPELKFHVDLPKDTYRILPLYKGGTKPTTIVQDEMELALRRKKSVEEATAAMASGVTAAIS